ncbi:MAG: carbohydrate binding domain-containing protein, partial [Clostridia bacterium]|nr:carbohydrate binding domain-containing protein [Clostridia bacterium]
LLPTVSFAKTAEVTPILRYTFDGDNALASENGGNALTLNGGAEITDEGNVGKGLLLDGVDGYALLPEYILSGSMTISAWVKINKFATWARVFDFGTDDKNNFFLSPYSGGTTRIEMKTPSDVNSVDAPQETEREWVHYAVTYDNGTINYYRNGRLLYTKSNLSIKPSDIKNELNYIGKSHYDADAYLSAVVDDFRVYDKALTADEIDAVFSEGEISGEILLKSYSIEDNQIITGDKIDLPQTDGLYWNEVDNLGLIDSETGAVKHSDQTEQVTLMAAYGDYEQEYTVYVTGANESPYTINIDAADRSKDVSDNMWGLFFEDINSAADGGLYAEMVQNRSFETEKDGHLYSWTTNGDVTVNTENPLNENNPTYVTLPAEKDICNRGFGNEAIKFVEGEKYDFSVYVRGEGELTIRLTDVSTDKDDYYIWAFGEETKIVCDSPNEWKKYTYTFNIDDLAQDITGLLIYNSGNTDLDLDMISLIPEDTYKGHGLRKDFMEALEAMHPKFLRFPGGCAIEGNTMETAWNWKDTVGDVAKRKEMVNIWSPSDNTYMMTYGLGFYEYFQMCEDLGMEPVPILNCGMACQARSGGKTDEDYLVPMDELQPYIDDALDLIEFANGTDESNKWVKLRIDMGHPEPFDMKYIGIGNEQFGDIYFERYYEFAKQIHEKYPEMNLVTTSGLASSGASNDLAWNWINEHTELADRVDEHYYENPDWVRAHAYRYDNYRRDTNSKVFLGEYASKGNAWYNALSEAAFMTGLERNADVVRMASYAPMFAKYGNTQWSAANMIWFNNEEIMLTPNYYVQSLYANNKGDYSLPTEVEMNGIDTDDTFKGGVVLGSWGTQNEFKDLELDKEVSFDNSIAGIGDWSASGDGVISQTSDATGSTYFYDLGDVDNYTFTVKARKLGGGEGFQIGVAAEDNLNYYRVNIGGWGNTIAKIQHIVNGVSYETGNVAEQSYVGDVHIEDDRWYDVKVEVTDYEIKAYLDGEFICSYTKPKSYGPI